MATLPIEVEHIARVCYEANRALQVVQANPAIPVSVPWDDLDQHTQESAIDGVANALAGAGPRESHENWMRFKLDAGWRLGPVKDEAIKEHPLLIPYDELPPDQKVKDQLFLAVVRALST